ncbi:hypothetical protein SPFM14_00098 [Salmonella phage SPFM14]|nr:hypothetical protein SPFM14_00098 [Salmonella phage SPFM14]
MKTYPTGKIPPAAHPSKMMTFNPKNINEMNSAMCNYSYSSFRPVDNYSGLNRARFFTGVVDAGSTNLNTMPTKNRYYATFLDYAIIYHGVGGLFSSDTEVRLTYATRLRPDYIDLTKLITDPSTPTKTLKYTLQSTGESWTEDLSVGTINIDSKTINFELTLTATTALNPSVRFSHARTADGISFGRAAQVVIGLNGVTGSGHDWAGRITTPGGVSTYAGIAVNYGCCHHSATFMHRISVLVARTITATWTPLTATADSVLETVILSVTDYRFVHNTFPMFQNNGPMLKADYDPAADKWTFKTTSAPGTKRIDADWRYAQASSYTMTQAEFGFTYGTGGPVWSTGGEFRELGEHIEDDNAHIRRGSIITSETGVVFVEIRNVTRLKYIIYENPNTAETETMTKIGPATHEDAEFGVYVDAAGDAGYFVGREYKVPLSTFNLAELFDIIENGITYTDWMVTIKANDAKTVDSGASINIIRYGLPGTALDGGEVIRQADAITEIEKVATTTEFGLVQFGTAVDDATLLDKYAVVGHTHTSAAFGIKRSNVQNVPDVQLPISPLQQAEYINDMPLTSSIYIDKTNFGLPALIKKLDQQFTGKLVAVKSLMAVRLLATEFGDREDLAATGIQSVPFICTFVPPESDDLGSGGDGLFYGTSTATVTINGNFNGKKLLDPTTVGPYLPGNEITWQSGANQLILYPDSRGLEPRVIRFIGRDSQTVNAGNNPITSAVGTDESEGVGAQFTVDLPAAAQSINGTFGMKPGLTSTDYVNNLLPKLSTLANKLLRENNGIASDATLVYGKTQPQLAHVPRKDNPHRDSWGAIRALQLLVKYHQIVDKLYRDAPAHYVQIRSLPGAPAPDVNNDVYAKWLKFKSGVNLNWWAGENDSFNVDNPPSEFAPGYQKTDVREGNGVYDITVKTSKQTVNYLTTGLTDTELAGEVEFSVVRAIYLTLTTAIGSGSSNYSYTWMLCYANGGASILRLQLKQRKYRLPSIPPETTLNPGELIDRRRYSLSYQNTTFDAYSLAVITSEQYATYDGTGGYTYNASRVDPIARNTLDLQYRAGVTLESELMEAIVAVGAKLGEAISIGDLYFPPVDIKFDWENWRGAAEREANKDRYPVDCQWDNVSGFTLDYHAIGIGEATAEMIMARTGHVCHGGVWITNPKYQGGKKLTLGDDYVITHAYVTGYRMLFPAHAPFYTTSLVVKSHYQEPGNMQTGEAVTPIGTK